MSSAVKAVKSLFKGKKSAEDYQQKIDKYNKQLEELEGQEDSDETLSKIAEIEGELKAAEEKLKKAQTKELTNEAKTEAYDKKLSELAAKKAEKEAAAKENIARLEEENKIKVLGGFFVYRAKPTTESKRIESILASQKEGPEDQFAQQGEITGMVLIKQSGDRTFMTYAPIDPKEYTVDKFMEYFKDTMLNNKYDDNIEKVFELESLGTLVNKLIVQTVEE